MKILNQHEVCLVSGAESILVTNRDTKEEIQLYGCTAFIQTKARDPFAFCWIPEEQHDDFKRITRRRNYDARVLSNLYDYY
ncbi:MAG: hypothetical protein AB7I18_03895 [Candidatus Berkiella sp.]